MAGTGNLLLKRGTIMPYNNSQDDIANDTDAKVLLKGMPAAQIVGLSPFYTAITPTQYIGTSSTDYPNRLWLGMDGYASSDPEFGGAGGVVEGDTHVPLTTSGATVVSAARYTRPLWVGAEIRASEPVKEDNTNAGDFVILKANWDKPSDYVLVTQKAIAKMPLRVYEATADGGQFVAKEYIEFGGWNSSGDETNISFNTKIFFPDWTAPAGPGAGSILKIKSLSGGSPNKIFLEWVPLVTQFTDFLSSPEGADVALLGNSGQTKGSQTFLSKLIVEQQLELNGYTEGETTYGATITSLSEDAYIFNENVQDISIGGDASVISIGNPSSTNSCTVTIYDELVVTGNLEANSIDGGSF
jgi:hypothetical protein